MVNDSMYNFVFFQNPNDYYRIAYSDAIRHPNVRVFFGIPNSNSLLRCINRIHFSEKLNSLIPLPGKSKWNILYNKTYFDNASCPICFIYNGGCLGQVESGLVSYLKKTYPDSRHVCFLQDIVSSYPSRYELVFNQFDAVITYDFGDSKEYGFLYHPTIYTRIELPENETIEKSDVFFVGAAKDRLDDIYKVYDLFSKAGKKCDFLISGVSEERRRNSPGVHYIKHISYLENLQHVAKTKALIDIVQGKSSGFTLRTWEAVYYNKLLFSNNVSVLEFMNDSKGVFYLDDSFNVKEAFDTIPVFNHRWKDETSLQHLLAFIESLPI